MSLVIPVPGSKALPELLAPAGSPEAFRAAVAAGADAVYLSGMQFGARKFAKNFSDAEIEESIRYAHARAVRVYVTVNTLIHDRELAGVAEYLVWLYSIGADAVLVQDIGVASLARRIVPDLPLHASTQLTIHSADGVKWAAEQGFSRVVLARELTLDEVNDIVSKTGHSGIGIEVFVHGALCYGYSGQCLLSSVIGGRSGNRGMCAQPCRKPYMLVTGDQDEYGCPVNLHALPQPERSLLSPKDLCTYSHLPELVRTSVASLKIEGRMKSPEYVATVVSIYRRALDAIARGTWQPENEDIQDLLLAFNRGFTSGYLFSDRHGALMGRDQPDNRGLFIGIVTRWDERSGKVTVQCDMPPALHPGDGLFFSYPDHKDTEWGFALNNEPVHTKNPLIFTIPRQVAAGARLYLTASASLISRARQIITRPAAGLRHPVPIDLTVSVTLEGSLGIIGVIDTGRGRPVTLNQIPDLQLVPAESRPLTRDQLEQQLRKTGGTPFAIRSFSLDYPGGMFAPVAELNRIRREFLVLAQETLLQANLPTTEQVAAAREQLAGITKKSPAKLQVPVTSAPQPTRIAVYADTIGNVEAAARAGADIICYEPTFYSDGSGCARTLLPGFIEAQIREALLICQKARVRMVWKLPRITHQKFLDAVFPLIPALRQAGLDECMIENMGAARAILSYAPGLHISGSVGLNIFNRQTVTELSHQGLRLLTLSPELSGTDISELTRSCAGETPAPELSVIVQGTLEALITEDCLLEPLRHCTQTSSTGAAGKKPFFGIMDETRRVFPFVIDTECRTHIANAVETCLIDHLPYLLNAGIRSVVIDARRRTPAYALEMVLTYKEAIGAAQPGNADAPRHLAKLKERIKKQACGGITTGPFLHGLKD